jgi:hypothetical protein
MERQSTTRTGQGAGPNVFTRMALSSDAWDAQLLFLAHDRVDAVLYLSRAGQVTGEVLHVDGGAHAGRW